MTSEAIAAELPELHLSLRADDTEEARLLIELPHKLYAEVIDLSVRPVRAFDHIAG